MPWQWQTHIHSSAFIKQSRIKKLNSNGSCVLEQSDSIKCGCCCLIRTRCFWSAVVTFADAEMCSRKQQWERVCVSSKESRFEFIYALRVRKHSISTCSRTFLLISRTLYVCLTYTKGSLEIRTSNSATWLVCVCVCSRKSLITAEKVKVHFSVELPNKTNVF